MKTNVDIAPAQTPEQVLQELKVLVDEAEKILGQPETAGSATKMENLRERFDAAQERIAAAYQQAKRKVAAGAKYTDETIREHPYQSMAVALGVGLLAGALVGRRFKGTPR